MPAGGWGRSQKGAHTYQAVHALPTHPSGLLPITGDYPRTSMAAAGAIASYLRSYVCPPSLQVREGGGGAWRTVLPASAR